MSLAHSRNRENACVGPVGSLEGLGYGLEREVKRKVGDTGKEQIM